MTDCYCGSGDSFKTCCQPIISGDKLALTAEQLMRARYSAYNTQDVDFLIASVYPSQRKDIDRDNVAGWAKGANWQGLEIIETEAGTADDDKGVVEFKAKYEQNKLESTHHELSSFRKEDDKWYFFDGRAHTQQKSVHKKLELGRNDPCHCGSGKKYKKCHMREDMA